MPVRRGETSPIFAAQCYAPNSFVGSRHQERLVSDRRTRAPPAKPLYTLPTARSAPSTLSAAALAAMSISLPTQ